MFHISFLILLCAVTSVYSQIPYPGKCPDVQPQSTLNLQKYLGSWYEIEAFPNAFERGRCIGARYTLKPNNHIEVFNSGVNNGKPYNATGDAYVPNTSDPAKLLVKFSAAAPYGNYWVIDTDYTQYTLIYSCEQISSLVHFEFAWILARERILDATIVQNLKNKLAGFKVDTSKFKESDQTGCM